MNSEMNGFKRALGFKWIKSEAGQTFLCPVGSARDASSLSDEELRELCLDESLNPQND